MSILPPWMPEPPEPHPEAGGPWFPHIIRHDVRDDGTVLVTWALPGLANATVRVPLASWLNGDHWPTGAFLAQQVQLPPQVGQRSYEQRPHDHTHD